MHRHSSVSNEIGWKRVWLRRQERALGSGGQAGCTPKAAASRVIFWALTSPGGSLPSRMTRLRASSFSRASRTAQWCDAQAALFRYIDGWYNPRRIQAGLDGLSPDEYEAAWQARQSQPHSATLQPEGAETR
jgi:hypothetical protein